MDIQPNFNQPSLDGYAHSNRSESRFLAQVYGLLSLTLLVSVLGSYYGGTHSALIESHYWMIVIGTFVLLFLTQMSSRVPVIAIPMVFIFAGSMGTIVGPAIAMYLKMPNGPSLVAEALGITTIMFIGLSVYAMVTKHNYSHLGGFLMTGLIVGILVSLLNVFFLHLSALQSALAGVFALVFSGLIVFDTQRLRENEGTVVGVVIGLYLDVINLFMAILEILGGSEK